MYHRLLQLSKNDFNTSSEFEKLMIVCINENSIYILNAIFYNASTNNNVKSSKLYILKF